VHATCVDILTNSLLVLLFPSLLLKTPPSYPIQAVGLVLSKLLLPRPLRPFFYFIESERGSLNKELREQNLRHKDAAGSAPFVFLFSVRQSVQIEQAFQRPQFQE
jgi:hypothetical protein